MKSGLKLFRKVIEIENTSDDNKLSCLDWEHWDVHQEVHALLPIFAVSVSRLHCLLAAATVFTACECITLLWPTALASTVLVHGWCVEMLMRLQLILSVQNEFLSVGGVRVLVRLLCHAEEPDVRRAAVIASVSMLFGGNDAVQQAFFREMKVLKDASCYKVLFTMLENAAATQLDASKEVR